MKNAYKILIEKAEVYKVGLKEWACCDVNWT
jgi:hypothetical protein